MPGSFFKFQFHFPRPRDVSPSRHDYRSVMNDWDMAKVGRGNDYRDFMSLLTTFQKSGVKIDSTETPVTPREQLACPLYSRVPVEIRTMIFCHLLTIPEPIEKAHKHLGSKDTALLDNYNPIPHIDAAVLRTCRIVYSEALPILYGQNTFEFSSANAIRSFQSKSLIGYPLGMRICFAELGFTLKC